ncbi:MAG: hypothetical protein WAO35_16235 [Terriglobia bacterium]
MNEPSTTDLNVKRLILIPALVTLAVTAARLVGEVMGGPQRLFNSAPGGPWAIVGIIWLAPIFGVYFALKLDRRGHGPKSHGRAAGFALLGAVLAVTLSFIAPLLHLGQHFWAPRLYLWAVVVVAALATLPGWTALFRTMAAYAYAARVPVVAVAFFAFWRHWATHYNAVPSGLPGSLGLLAKFVWLGFFPQLIFWAGLTVLVGMVLGCFAAGITHLARRNPQT